MKKSKKKAPRKRKVFFSSFLFYYSTLAAFFVISSALYLGDKIPFISQIMLLPVAMYFLMEVFRRLQSNKEQDAETSVNLSAGAVFILVLVFVLLTSFSLFKITSKVGVVEITPTNIAAPSSEPFILKKSQELPKIRVVIDDGSSFVNLRKTPSTASEKIGEVENDETYEYTKKEGVWYKLVLEDGGLGYLHSNYVKEEPND